MEAHLLRRASHVSGGTVRFCAGHPTITLIGMITESQILKSTQEANAILADLLSEVRHTNALLEWLGEVIRTPQQPPSTPKPA